MISRSGGFNLGCVTDCFAEKKSIILRKYAEKKVYICRMNGMHKYPIYIWQHDDWPNFTYNKEPIMALLNSVEREQARVAGMLLVMGFETQRNTSLESITEDVVRSSEIEGELLNLQSVRSSVARHLGIEQPDGYPADHYTEGLVQVQMDAVRGCHQPLTKDRLCNWHAALFPTGRSGMYSITVADWRKGEEPMLIVSGAMGKERIHYEAPPSCAVSREMNVFLSWINESTEHDMLKAAVAHLWFVAIHPFDDGNGRLSRTITDMLMARQCSSEWLYYSVSAEILRQRKEYYDILHRTTCGGTDITEWIVWFLQRTRDAIETAARRMDNVLRKAEFWQHHTDLSVNERQRKMINELFEGFEGPLTSSKWAKICHCSPDTALRDIADLLAKGILTKTPSGGRSTHYELAAE